MHGDVVATSPGHLSCQLRPGGQVTTDIALGEFEQERPNWQREGAQTREADGCLVGATVGENLFESVE